MQTMLAEARSAKDSTCRAKGTGGSAVVTTDRNQVLRAGASKFVRLNLLCESLTYRQDGTEPVDNRLGKRRVSESAVT